MATTDLKSSKIESECPFGIVYRDGDTHLYMDIANKYLDIYDVDIIVQWLSSFRRDMIKAREEKCE